MSAPGKASRTPIHPRDAVTAFNEYTAVRGVALAVSTPREGLEQMLSFFEATSAAGCSGPDGDMLLLQWGTFDWGDGRHFEFNVTRQFIEQGLEDDDAISQLSLTYKFEPTPELEAMGEGNRWCHGLDEVAAFRAFVSSSAPCAAVANRPVLAVELDHSYV